MACENASPGNPETEWDLGGITSDPTIQGFATAISVNRGEMVQFKIKTDAKSYRLDIYRLGYYGGLGARKVSTVNRTGTTAQVQPTCLSDAGTGLIDCGNWGVSLSWQVPATSTSGIYLAKAIRADTGGASHIVFIVRDDTRSSDVVFQTPDTTWQAYNSYGGNSLYEGNPAGRAYEVSYNRPFNTRENGYGQAWLFGATYPMVRWAERNGYDVTYITGKDADRDPVGVRSHRLYLSVGHDEYWAAAQRANVEAARAAGVHLGFFSGNEVFWKIRWQSSIDGSATDYRTIVCYKETKANSKIDPDPAVWTGTWRDPRFSPPADGGQPENALTGTIFTVNGLRDDALAVPQTYSRLRFWRNTSVANLGAGQSAVFPKLLGYEWDEDLDNGFRPAGLIHLSSTTVSLDTQYLLDYGSTYGAGTATHNLSLYRHASGALVFGAGTVRYSWGLDEAHDGSSVPADPRIQQATANLFADMGVLPLTLISGLVAPTPSSDTVGPVVSITAPASNAEIPLGTQVSVTGTASDASGQVAGVEISLDGGSSWRRAQGLTSWSYTWSPSAGGPINIRVRAIDDSVNLTTPAASRDIFIADVTPPTITLRTPAPAATFVAATSSVEVTFNEAMSAATISGGTLQLRDASGTLVPAAVTYDPGYFRAEIDPSMMLPFAQTFTVRVAGGASGVKDTAGNSLAADAVWSFTTAARPIETLWPAVTVPGTIDSGDTAAYELGLKFRASVGGTVTGVRFYKSTANVGGHSGTLWTSGGQILATVTFSGESPSGWQEAAFSSPVSITAGTTYVVSYHTSGHYSYNGVYFSGGPYVFRYLEALGAAESPNGVFRPGASGFPSSSSNSANYWVDVAFVPNVPPDVTPPQVISKQPVSGATGVMLWPKITASFDEEMEPSTITGASIVLRAASGNAVPSSVTYDRLAKQASLIPTGQLATNAVYTVTVRGGVAGVRDLSNNALAADFSWDFTTGPFPECPCSVWDPLIDAPARVDSGDPAAYELGVRFQAHTNGAIAGLRFYKSAANMGQHIAHLWTSGGTLLATGVFQGETASGWQEMRFPQPVSVLANTTYVASYYAPNGHYAIDSLYFVPGSAYGTVLEALGKSQGPNGVFNSGGSGFPASGSSNNYWVDVVFLMPEGDTVNPRVTTTAPGANAAFVSPSSAITARFSEAMAAATITGATIEVRDQAGSLVPALVTYDQATWTAVAAPSAALTPNGTYTVRVRGGANGVKDLSGNPLLADAAWTFATAGSTPLSIWSPSTVPGLDDSADEAAYELGVKFRATTGGYVTGVRFYKSALNNGVHTGTLWTQDGRPLATATFSNETASGWQEAIFASPVVISSSIVYVVSYHASVGHYAFSGGYFNAAGASAGPLEALSASEGANGVFKAGASGFPSSTNGAANYWVDLNFIPYTSPDATAPTVVAQTPAPGATYVSTSSAAGVRFNEPMSPSSVNSSTVELRDQTGATVTGAVSYDSATFAAVITPAAPLHLGQSYSVSIKGGSSGLKDAAGNSLSSDGTWTFTTAPSPPLSIWSSATAPGVADAGDPGAYELGVKFRPSGVGYVSGIRFYKSAANTGIHTGSLWTVDGQLLASTVYSSESASGWQEATFSTPVLISAGSVYVASYHSPAGHYSYGSGYFSGSNVVSGPLEALGNSESPNGVFKEGLSGFPSRSAGAANYWVDVVFATADPNSNPQYQLTTTASPSAGGSITAGGWFDSGTSVAVSATPNAGYQFTGFAGDLTGTTNPQDIVMTAPKSVTATFATSGTAPAITSANNTTFTVGTAGSFSVTATGSPAPTLSETGALPSGVAFNATTRVLSGTPAPGTSGNYSITFTAANGVGSNAVQSFTLTVNAPPAITSANSTTFTVGIAGSFTVTATGFPPPTLSETGALPSGIAFNPTTQVLSGTPAPGTSGTYNITFTAANGVGSNAVQSFALKVIALQSISVTPANPTISIAGTQQFVATGTYTDGTVKTITNSVTWSSINTSVATITSAGVATGVAAGTSNIHATLASISGTTILTVQPALVSITITPVSPSTTVGTTLQFNATGMYSDSSTQNLTNSVTWTSSRPRVATINTSGLATAVARGTTNIKAKLGAITSPTTALTVTP